MAIVSDARIEALLAYDEEAVIALLARWDRIEDEDFLGSTMLDRTLYDKMRLHNRYPLPPLLRQVYGKGGTPSTWAKLEWEVCVDQ